LIDITKRVGVGQYGRVLCAQATNPHNFIVMLLSAVANWRRTGYSAHAGWALIPLTVFAFGWAMMVPVVTLLVLDLHPERRGMASSLQMFVGSTANGIVAGVIAPLVMHSTVALATHRC
jgi:DHA1 family bicyclomycin/chloramphenicol resistance-like MFS transporter